MSTTHCPLNQLRDNPKQIRLDMGEVEALAASILQHGLRQLPEGRLVVDGEQPSYSAYTHATDGDWYLDEDPAAIVVLASGHRRVHAVQLLNDDETVTDADLRDAGLVPGYVPVDLQRLGDEEMLDLLTIENSQREELSPIEEARLISAHLDAGRDTSHIAEQFGKSPSWVSNRRRLTQLPTYVQEHVHEGDLSVRQGMALAMAFAVQEEYPDFVEQVNVDLKPGTMVKKAVRGDLTSDGIRDLTRELADLVERHEETQDYMEATEPDERDEGKGWGNEKAEEIRTQNSTEQPNQHDERPPKQEADSQSNGRSEDHSVDESSAADHERGDDRGQGERDSDPKGDEARVDEAEHSGPEGQAGEVSGDGAPADLPVTDVGGEPGVLGRLIAEVESDGCEWRLKSIDEGRYHSTVQRGGTGYMAEGATPAEALQSAYEHSQSNKVGHVAEAEVSALLSSSDPGSMWDQEAAGSSSIASLYVAYVVADERQERWRREEIAQEMRERQQRVTEEDFPESVWEDAQAEIDRRLEPKEA